jgi:membrane-associated protease RseP (regulator of RpoE activity)
MNDEQGFDLQAIAVPRRKLYRPRMRALPSDKPWINLILFLLTVVSTWMTWGGWYSVAVISILLAHEMGHYTMCRRYGIPATLPFFIPFPYANPFGTLGAMIQLHGHFPNRRALFDMGAAGPLAGLAVTLLVIVLGFIFDPFFSGNSVSPYFLPGPPLLFQIISYGMSGAIVTGADVMRNPLLWAGWVGLFVTSLNLIPIGQLDGGHICYSVFSSGGSKWMVSFIVLLGALAFFYHGWLLLFVLLLLFGRRHPPPLDDFTPLDGKRKMIAFLLAVIFLVTFSPIPFNF